MNNNTYRYIPDSLTNSFGCQNEIWSPAIGTTVYSPFIAKTNCPFGKSNTANQGIFMDQYYINQQMNTKTPWGRAPQMDPRPLAKIGSEWRTS